MEANKPHKRWPLHLFVLGAIVVAALTVADGFGAASARQRNEHQSFVASAAIGQVKVEQGGEGGHGRLWNVTVDPSTGAGVEPRSFRVSTVSDRLSAVFAHGGHMVLLGELGGGTSEVTVVDLAKQQAIGAYLTGLLEVSPSQRYLAYVVPGPNRTRDKSDDTLMVSDLWTEEYGKPAEGHVPVVVYRPPAKADSRIAIMAPPQWVDATTVAFAVAESTDDERPTVVIVCADVAAGVKKARTAAQHLDTAEIADVGRLGSLGPEATGVVVRDIARLDADGMVLRVTFGDRGVPKVPYADVRMW
jgi:hypothetical protein